MVVLLNGLHKFPFLSRWMIFSADVAFVAISFFLSYYIRYSLLDVVTVFDLFFRQLLACVVIAGIFFFIFKTSSEFIRFSSFWHIMRVYLSIFCIHISVFFLFSFFPAVFNYSKYTLISLIISFLISGSIIINYKIIINILYDLLLRNRMKKKGIPLLIFGIDAVHIEIARLIRMDEKVPYNVVGFIACNPLSNHHQIMGSPVYPPEDVLNEVIINKGIKTILVRAEDLESDKNKALFRRFTEHKVQLLSLPHIDKLKNIRRMQKININDLLQRSPIKTDIAAIGKNMKGKTVLVTGAAGSIGREMVRQLSRFELEKLLLVDIAETPLHQLSLELHEMTNVTYIPLVADVRNIKRMKPIIEQYKPHYIFHAAAYKHVPLMEKYPSEAVLTNVLGTKIMADLAVVNKAECFVMISTDKAVNPSNVMGASKRIAEMYIQSLSSAFKIDDGLFTSDLRLITTRFGNVLGSNGSVVPRFAKQIAEGGPITVTHPDIIRYFMTIPEACSLVLEAGNLGKGGEVFLFDMGESVKISTLAEEMIRLSGLEPYKDINIVYTGLRPGEKLHEELLYDKEKTQTSPNKRIMIGNVRQYDFLQVSAWLQKLLQAAHTFNELEVVKVMKEIVPEFISNNSEFEVLDKSDPAPSKNGSPYVFKNGSPHVSGNGALHVSKNGSPQVAGQVSGGKTPFVSGNGSTHVERLNKFNPRTVGVVDVENKLTPATYA